MGLVVGGGVVVVGGGVVVMGDFFGLNLYCPMKPSAVRLRSDRNWIRSWFPSDNTGLRTEGQSPRRRGPTPPSHERITYAGGLSPQYLPILLASLISPPLKMETWS